MLIEDYFQQLNAIVNKANFVFSLIINSDKRSNYQGFIFGEITFKDGSILSFREFVSVENSIERGMYSYQYMTHSKQLIFRYDNTQHHKKLNLPTYPHHKHEGHEDNVLASSAPTLKEVLNEIDQLLIFSGFN